MVIYEEGLYKTATDISCYKKAITRLGWQSRMKTCREKAKRGNKRKKIYSCIPAGPTAGSVKKRKEEMEKDTSLLHLVSTKKGCLFHEIKRYLQQQRLGVIQRSFAILSSKLCRMIVWHLQSIRLLRHVLILDYNVWQSQIPTVSPRIFPEK